jgi:hypothetical protein
MTPHFKPSSKEDQVNTPSTIALDKKLAVVGVVVVIGFVCGWSATGATGGAVTAIALGAGISAAVFTTNGCSRRPKSHVPPQHDDL